MSLYNGGFFALCSGKNSGTGYHDKSLDGSAPYTAHRNGTARKLRAISALAATKHPDKWPIIELRCCKFVQCRYCAGILCGDH